MHRLYAEQLFQGQRIGSCRKQCFKGGQMILRVPSYYKDFHCIADRCRNNCCIGWEIDIDEDTDTYYKTVAGAFGERLRSHMVWDGCSSFALTETGWCPFLNEKKLCDICMELGEEALCEVCTEFPRFTMEYENVREKVLSLACEEVGRLIFSSAKKITWEELEAADTYAWEADTAEADKNRALELETIRERAVAILQDRRKPVFVRAAEYLLYCEKMQQRLYGCHAAADMQTAAVRLPERQSVDEAAAAAQAYQDFLARMESYGRLETLEPCWTQTKHALLEAFSAETYRDTQKKFLEKFSERAYEYEHLLVYFTHRYFMRAYYDANLCSKAKFAVAGVLMIRDMDLLRFVQTGGEFTLDDRIDTARIYAREVEHSEENMEQLAEDLQFEEVFGLQRLIEQLLP